MRITPPALTRDDARAFANSIYPNAVFSTTFLDLMLAYASKKVTETVWNLDKDVTKALNDGKPKKPAAT